jgi:hypothetical protein
MNGMDAVNQIRNAPSKVFDLCRQIAGLRGAIFAARKPGRVSLRSKDSQKRSCARQSRLSMLRESLRGCAAASELHSSR